MKLGAAALILPPLRPVGMTVLSRKCARSPAGGQPHIGGSQALHRFVVGTVPREYGTLFLGRNELKMGVEASSFGPAARRASIQTSERQPTKPRVQEGQGSTGVP